MHLHTAFALVLVSTAGCATPPRPTQATVELAKNARAVLEGRVVDRRGLPVAGIRVEAMPRARDIPWSSPATTDAEGHFRLSVFAPAEYGFALAWKERTLVTPEEDDPARLRVSVKPGDQCEGIEVIFLREEWESLP